MKYHGPCISVSDVNLSRKFYEDLFGLEVFQNYGINISFTCGLSLQQDFDRLLNIPKELIAKKSHNMELYFEEDNFNGFISKIKQRNDINYIGNGVIEAPWGQRCIRFYDLDHPMNHWLIWNIPAISTIPGNLPKEAGHVNIGNAVQKTRYRGPNPPKGVRHKYQFNFYILDCELNIKSASNKASLEKAMEGHIIQYGFLNGYFE